MYIIRKSTLQLIGVLLLTAAVLAVSAGENVIRAIGLVRGQSRNTMRNKYAGFVTRVNFTPGNRVKKGDVILEYDDLEIRTAITKLENEIAEQIQLVDLKKLNLKLIRLDPLPSQFRNLQWKKLSSQERLRRYGAELDAYKKLHASKAVSDLALQEKQQLFTDYQAETASLDHDIRIVKQGLANLYVEKAEKELAQAEVHLASLQKELLLLKEELKYYKITAPFDGYCVIESDTVGSYNSAGTAAAYVHKDDRKRIYAYFKEEDIHRIYEGMKCRVISNQYGPEKIFEAQIYAIKRYRYEYGAGVYFEVRFNLTGEPQPLRIDSNVIIEIPKQ
ncbi:MAG: HlyD family efflux transporter periplasmic adaptor subunit [Lentisphaerae bacterium]|nr:HlyD family efflux transporter periplasmic adaptor subunit [Lentisphaerota bacterium]